MTQRVRMDSQGSPMRRTLVGEENFFDHIKNKREKERLMNDTLKSKRRGTLSMLRKLTTKTDN